MPKKPFDLAAFRAELAEWLTLDDWRMLRDALALVDSCNAPESGPTASKRKPIRTWTDLAARLDRHRAAMPRRFKQIAAKLRSLAPDNNGAMIDEETWSLTALGQRVRLAAASLLETGLEGSLDLLCNDQSTTSRPLVISAAEAVKTYLFPYVPSTGLPYELLPWTPYMTSRAAAELLLSRRADLVITWADRGEIPRTVEAEDFGPERGVRLLVHHTHPVAQRRLTSAESKKATTVPASELAGEVFAAPLDTHLATTAHSLIDTFDGNIRVSNVGRFPQAITHVQLTRAFTVFPDWPWCLRTLRKTSGLLPFPLEGVPAQKIMLRAMWRAGESSSSTLSAMRRAVVNAYVRLCESPSWKLLPISDKTSNVLVQMSPSSLCYFHAPSASRVAPAPGWVSARVVWDEKGAGLRTGRWLVSEDRADMIRVTVSTAASGFLIQMIGADGLSFAGSGILCYAAERRGERKEKPGIAVGTISFSAASGELVSTPCVLSQDHLQTEGLDGIRDELDEVTLND
jgi:DNA-binding transcriptional LysR family regulator